MSTQVGLNPKKYTVVWTDERINPLSTRTEFTYYGGAMRAVVLRFPSACAVDHTHHINGIPDRKGDVEAQTIMVNDTIIATIFYPDPEYRAKPPVRDPVEENLKARASQAPQPQDPGDFKNGFGKHDLDVPKVPVDLEDGRPLWPADKGWKEVKK